MKIPVMTLTIALSTFSACLVSSEVQHGTKLGMRRHIINSKRPATTLSSTEKAFQDNKQASHAEEPGLPASNASSHQHEKRAYYGQGTYFDPGEGACGWYASAGDHIAALNGQQYGDMGRRSPHCGSWIRITNRKTGATTKAKVQDACPGCGYGSLDLSPAAFDDLAPRSQGVVQIEWDFV